MPHNLTTCDSVQLHLYDLVAVRKQQVGTAQALNRTQRASLGQHAAAVSAAGVSIVCSPTKLISAHPGKENALSASGMESDAHLLLPLHAPSAKPAHKKQLRGHQSGVHDCKWRVTHGSVLLLLKSALAMCLSNSVEYSPQ